MSPEELTEGARVRRRFKPDETGIVVGWRVNSVAEGETPEHIGHLGDDGADRVVVRLEPPVPDGKGGHTIMCGSPLTKWELCPPE